MLTQCFPFCYQPSVTTDEPCRHWPNQFQITGYPIRPLVWHACVVTSGVMEWLHAVPGADRAAGQTLSPALGHTPDVT